MTINYCFQDEFGKTALMYAVESKLFYLKTNCLKVKRQFKYDRF